jgi:hypothetical protein
LCSTFQCGFEAYRLKAGFVDCRNPRGVPVALADKLGRDECVKEYCCEKGASSFCLCGAFT